MAEYEQHLFAAKRFKVSAPLWLIAWVLLLINAQFIYISHAQGTYAGYYLEAIRRTGTTVNSARLSLLGKDDFPARYGASLEKIRADNPMPELPPELLGGTDLYPNDVAVVMAYGLSYSPRPVIQSFSAYTGHLAEINAASLRADDAPDTVLFDVQTIDERLPSSEDGLSWPELLTRYDLADATGKYWVLKRKATANQYSLKPLSTQRVALGDWVNVPTEDSSAVWVELDAEPVLVGKLMTTLLKLPPLYIEVELADGSVERRRVLADILHSGQLLSPLVLDRGDFAYFAGEDWPETLQSLCVRRMRLMVKGVGAIAYPNRYDLSFSRLEFPPQDLSDVPGWKRLAGLAALKRGQTINAVGERLKAKSGPHGKMVLQAHANTRVVVDLPAGPKKLRLGYGILDEAWQEAQTNVLNLFADRTDTGPLADGVEFHVLALGEEETETLLFSQWIDPHANVSDRGEKTVELDLSNISAKKLALDTLSGPARNGRWDWAYWSMFDIDGDELKRAVSGDGRSPEA